ncbi:uncharacterized protein LOC130614837 isoform X1 [Hydractinia symbiolongicarpus]|uniref:uncharacterized protein LOC130614837 isoform X1 n=2 Tax=Hydractinia symbiolongicarpus TaxID=13093 RepID=UPI00254A33E1|nr:uncharacterized protein LOC130614837 isoform X1 [Hydractinia symbiolongicarpus]
MSNRLDYLKLHVMSLRLQVLQCYKQLMQTTLKLFSGDVIALEKSKEKIKEAFLAQRMLTAQEDILEQIKIAKETDEFLRQGVLQGVRQESSNVYKVKITEETKLHDNVPLKETNQINLNNFKVPEKYKNKS